MDCERYKRADMNETVRKLHPEMQWRDVDRELEREEKEWELFRSEGGRQRGDPYPQTPWLNSVTRAARIAKMEPADIRFEIHHYAKRNQLCHSEIKELIKNAQFEALGRQIVADKRKLNEMYEDNPRVVVEYRLAIGRLEEEWFKSSCWLGRDGAIHIDLSDKAIAKMRSFF